MATGNPTDCERPDPDSPAADDELIEAGVLGFVLEEHPAHLTIPELSLAMNRGKEDFSAIDAVERAVGELIGAGLLHIGASLVLPTRAALYFARLPMP